MTRRITVGVLLCLCLTAYGDLDKVGKKRPEGPVKGLRIHEWGVFHIVKDGCKAAGGGEAPAFIQRVPAELPPLALNPAARPNTVAKEPILHIYAPEAMALHVEVSFPTGKPTLAWPAAQAGLKPCAASGPGIPRLAWDLQVDGELKEGEPHPPEMLQEHWISGVRKVGSDLLCSGEDVEHFLFYEGELKHKSTLHVGFGDPNLVTVNGRTESTEAWVLRGEEKTLSKCHLVNLSAPREDPPMGTLEGTTPADLQAELLKALVTAGLSEAEAGALLTIWMPELTKPGTRLAYVLSREEYDRLLPIHFSPEPEELRRVGLVVQEISP